MKQQKKQQPATIKQVADAARAEINYSPEQFQVWQKFSVLLNQGQRITAERKDLMECPFQFLFMP